MQLIPDPIQTILKAHSTQIAAASAVAQIILNYNNIALPWWATVGLFGLLLLGRVIKQPSISGAADDAMDQVQ